VKSVTDPSEAIKFLERLAGILNPVEEKEAQSLAL